MNKTPHSLGKALQVAVMVCAAAIVLVKWTQSGEGHPGYDVSDAQGIERNERSTPRSFVLPATPGIAFEQERQDVGRANLNLKCVRRLQDLGYEAEDRSLMLNIQLVEAVYRHQVMNGLPATGRLDLATMKSLECS